jgi:uncharacterized protein involved in exopolysaccharide biosynthesis
MPIPDLNEQGALIQVVDPAIPPDRYSLARRGLIVIDPSVAGFVIEDSCALVRSGLGRMKGVLMQV